MKTFKFTLKSDTGKLTVLVNAESWESACDQLAKAMPHCPKSHIISAPCIVPGPIVLRELSGKYGAPIGRDNQQLGESCKLQKVKMSSCGAYDCGGAYWGIGTQLWVAEDLDGSQFFVRAKSRKEAKAEIIRHNPAAYFYR